ncbi:MlaD family protein [Hoyosella subflava]|uniref:Virulence factor Mce family protein n=1 Tax=Hoyosella subflava (strain DSM 45089 / JCM 17490 / NBRC 109087 / DQS3-9A1) TaxID=443218 RepID=F6EHS5_HOYSD|nr:MlaD family protein [Hoyosella subflava]AEF38873.1 Virulence factor Mce family protein [Hoyosella subflava DQS3-9A1]
MRLIKSGVLSALIAIPIAIAGTGCSMGMQNISFDLVEGRATYPIEVELETADLVMVGSEVRLGQRLLGRVADLRTDVAPDGRRIAVATVSLDSDAELPRDATITVELPNTLGNPYLRVRLPDEPSSEMFQPGDRMTEEQTFRGPDLENALASLSLVLSEGGVGSLEVIANEMELAVGDRGEEINRLVTSLRSTAQLLSAQSGNIDRALTAAAGASEQLAAQRDAFERGLDAAIPVFDQLNDQWPEIADLMASVGGLSGELDVIMTAAEDDLLALPAELADLLEALRSVEIRSVLLPMTDFLTGVANAQRGDYLAFDGTLNIPDALSYLLIGERVAQTGGIR